MRKLLSADFSRLFRSKIYWLGMFFMFGFAAFAVYCRYRNVLEYPDFVYPAADGLLFSGGMYIAIVLAVFISIWVGTDYSDGTIRNKLTVGHKRGAIYFSNWLTCTAASLMMHIIYILTVFALGSLLLEPFKTPAKVLAISTLASCFTVVAMTSIFLLLAMLINSKSTGAVVSMIVALVLLFSAMMIYSRLGEPEYYEDYYEMTVNGEVIQGEPEPNPNYLRGTKRDIYQFAHDAMPVGQMLQYGERMDIPDNIEFFPVYSLVIILVTAGCGWGFFRRKDLK